MAENGSRRSPAAEGEPRHLMVGSIRKPHGIRGEFFVWLETDRPETVFRPGRVLILGDAAGRPTDESLTVERARPFKEGVLLKAAEHGTRNEAADALRGRSLLIPESEAEPLGEGEVFYHQLIGMVVLTEETPVGTIREIQETPASDLLVIERQGAKDLLVPFIREMIREIRPDERVVEIDPPAGLLEL